MATGRPVDGGRAGSRPADAEHQRTELEDVLGIWEEIDVHGLIPRIAYNCGLTPEVERRGHLIRCGAAGVATMTRPPGRDITIAAKPLPQIVRQLQRPLGSKIANLTRRHALRVEGEAPELVARETRTPAAVLRRPSKKITPSVGRSGQNRCTPSMQSAAISSDHARR